MSLKAKMHYSRGLEYLVSGYANRAYSISYLSKNTDDKYVQTGENPAIALQAYIPNMFMPKSESAYQNSEKHNTIYASSHEFAPQIFLNPSRPYSRLVVDKSEIISIANETFELMMKEKLPENISINLPPADEFKSIHSIFGAWSSGILGFSINGKNRQIFVKENRLDELMIVLGHEIGHVLTETLPNSHDEEAKAFAFTVEWAATIKKHNIANLGLSVKDELDLQPARNGLHDISFGFVNFMVKSGRKAIELHADLIKGYLSIFNKIYRA